MHSILMICLPTISIANNCLQIGKSYEQANGKVYESTSYSCTGLTQAACNQLPGHNYIANQTDPLKSTCTYTISTTS